MNLQKIIGLLIVMTIVLSSTTVSARYICEGEEPPPGWKRIGMLKSINECPTGRGYEIKKK